MGIKRWWVDDDGESEPQESTSGEWVKYEDVKKLIEEKEQEIYRLKDLHRELNQELRDVLRLSSAPF